MMTKDYPLGSGCVQLHVILELPSQLNYVCRSPC